MDTRDVTALEARPSARARYWTAVERRGRGASGDWSLASRAAENRFLAARDGAEASLIDARLGVRRPVAHVLDSMLELCTPHAEDLGCVEELQWTRNLAATPRAVRQVDLARGPDKLPGLVEALAALF